MKTIINNLHNDWVNVKNKCRTTVGKKYTENIPNSTFKQNLLISEHSPIRMIEVDWSWLGIKSWIATHFSRHKWEKFISTQRTDRTNKDRDELKQSASVDFDGIANAQNLIDTSRKRLCYMSSSETREYWEDLKLTLYKLGEEELSNVLVPNCIYRCGCPEFNDCGYFKRFTNNKSSDDLYDIATRYKLYNVDFFKNKEYSIRTN